MTTADNKLAVSMTNDHYQARETFTNISEDLMQGQNDKTTKTSKTRIRN